MDRISALLSPWTGPYGGTPPFDRAKPEDFKPALLGAIEANEAAQIYSSTVFNFSSFTVAAILFLILTIPLARFTDRLIDRDRRRRLAGAAP